MKECDVRDFLWWTLSFRGIYALTKQEEAILGEWFVGGLLRYERGGRYSRWST